MGGICLNWGCIPTKALLRTSEVYGLIKHAEAYGLSVKDVTFDPKKIVERSRKVASQLSNGVSMLMKKNKITVFDGTAKLAGTDGARRKIAVALKDKSSVTLTAKDVILATGARARQLPGLEADGKLVWSYKEAMVPPEFPKSLLVIGSGAIGIELLPDHGRRGDGGRGDGPRAAGRGRRGFGLRQAGVREAGDEDPDQRHSFEPEEGRQ